MSLPRLILLSDPDCWICGPTTPVRQTLERLNDLAIDQQFQVVVGTGGEVLGTITDGDVRRAILAGVGLDAPVSAAMHRKAVVGRIGADSDNMAKIGSLSSHVPFLPLVDARGRLCAILIPDDRPSVIDTALVMAGGFGRRLGEHTRTTPKPLLPVGGRPILDHILSRLEESRIRRVFISVHYLAEQIVRFVEARDSRMEITCIHDGTPRGTAGAIAALPALPDGGLVVLNGDLVTSVDFDALVQFHDRAGVDATLAVAQHEFAVPYGVVRHTAEGQFLGIDEKPTVRHFVSAGIYCLSRDLCTLVPPDRAMDMPELINRGREIGLKVGLFPIHEYWTDIGRPADLAEARARAEADLAATR
ncbi:MAG: NTP transferase domain-containing protein [Rhodospirillaceae bacterium]|nr:NTP transferase domain-containing protein [Rhodospirillaceae bacterium]